MKPLFIQIIEAKPNKMFTEEQRALVRFLRYSAAVECAECGRRSKAHWTLLVSFEAKSMGSFTVTGSGKVHMPLTPVCGTHLLAWADMPPLPPRPRKRKELEKKQPPKGNV